MFHLCDPEGKGYITRQEIARFCDRRNSALDQVMTSLDADHDGQISFEEFQSGFKVCVCECVLREGDRVIVPQLLCNSFLYPAFLP